MHITCGRCRLRSRSSPPLPKTTVLGAETGALGARKALTPAAHASATISRAMIAAKGSTRCYNGVVTKWMRHRAITPPPRDRLHRRLILTRSGPVCIGRALPARHGRQTRARPPEVHTAVSRCTGRLQRSSGSSFAIAEACVRTRRVPVRCHAEMPLQAAPKTAASENAKSALSPLLF